MMAVPASSCLGVIARFTVTDTILYDAQSLDPKDSGYGAGYDERSEKRVLQNRRKGQVSAL
jgi:hypothetical protein